MFKINEKIQLLCPRRGPNRNKVNQQNKINWELNLTFVAFNYEGSDFFGNYPINYK